MTCMTREQSPSTDLTQLVEAYHRHGASKRPEDFWAWERAGDIARGDDPERAWELVVALIRSAPDERLEFIGAGPLECLVETHAGALIDRIIGEAERDSRFREALATIWLSVENVPPAALERLQAVTGNRLLVATQAEIDAAGAELERQWRADDAQRALGGKPPGD